MSDPLDK
jgi:hypothetical protein